MGSITSVGLNLGIVVELPSPTSRVAAVYADAVSKTPVFADIPNATIRPRGIGLRYSVAVQAGLIVGEFLAQR